ncbi:PAS domain-containing protein, partial [candidate division KSB3 bacterium]|nr:PAS domain-containing protein [candidate division KSB3 bacterium]MBD3324973.1 PAS domain-containing protein [candidate division KSB3 bacterium]
MKPHDTVLVIDDDPHFLQGIVRILQTAGYTVAGAATAQEGLRMAHEMHPELILLDVDLPDGNGIELCHHVKTDPALDGVLVIFVSGTKTASNHQAAGLESGADGYILKPIPKRELLARVQAMLRLKETETRLSHSLHELQQKNEALHVTQHLLSISQKKYLDLYDFAPVGYCTFDRQGQIVEANLTAANQLQIPRPRLLNTSFADYLPAADHATFFAHLTQVFTTRTRQTCELRIHQDTASPGYIALESIAVQPDEEAFDRCRTTLSDITERKKAEEALRQSEAFNRSIIQSSPDCIKVLDKDGRLQFMSKGGQELMGIHDLGQYLNMAYPEFWQDEANRLAQDALVEAQHGRTGRFQGFLPTETGDPKWWDVVITPIQGQHGSPDHLLAISRDITDRKQAEFALEHAKRAAEAANHAKTEFLATMSHELRTPLNGILGYAQILRQNPALTEQQRKGLSIIQRSGEHLLTLLNDILDLSSIEVGTLELQCTPFYLSKMLESLVELTTMQAEQKAIRFVYHACPEMPQRLCGDEKRLRQILLNLLGNAVKFTDNGQVA